MSKGAKIGIGIGVLVGIVAAVWFFFFRKKPRVVGAALPGPGDVTTPGGTEDTTDYTPAEAYDELEVSEDPGPTIGAGEAPTEGGGDTGTGLGEPESSGYGTSTKRPARTSTGKLIVTLQKKAKGTEKGSRSVTTAPKIAPDGTPYQGATTTALSTGGYQITRVSASGRYKLIETYSIGGQMVRYQIVDVTGAEKSKIGGLKFAGVAK